MEPEYTILVPYFDNLKRQKTYGGYRKRDVLNEIKRALDLSQIEVALQWTVELHLSGYERDFYEYLFLYIFDFYWADVDICFFLDTFSHALSKKTQKIVRQKKEYDHLSTLNDSELRHMNADLISKISTLPRRRISFSSKKVEARHFQIRHIGELIQAPNFSFSEKITRGRDSREIMIAANEICYNIHQKNMTMVNFWIEWLFILEKELKKKKQKILCEERPNQQLSKIVWGDWFLVIWNILNHFGSNDRVIFRIYNYFLEHFSIGKKHQWIKIFSYCFYRILFLEPFSKEEINQVNFRPIIITNLLIHRFYKHYFSQDSQIQITKEPEEDIIQTEIKTTNDNKEIIINKNNQDLSDKNKIKKTRREIKEEEEEIKRKKMEDRMKYLDYTPIKMENMTINQTFKPQNNKIKTYFEKVFEEEKNIDKNIHKKYEKKPIEDKIKNIEIPDELLSSSNNKYMSQSQTNDETYKTKKKEICLDSFPSKN